MTHIFIVNENTFDYHLRYLFAGTGYGDNEPDLDKIDGSEYHAEKTLTAMISDISKVREDDFVIFYVRGCKKFFGIFQVASVPFFNSLQDNYLGSKNELDKYLPFRIKIKPYRVYPIGVTEHSALDEIDGLSHPYEMCWSLIYRKLAGNRGCSFVTESEYKNLKSLIEKANTGYIDSNYFYYDKSNQIISPMHEECRYTGKTNKSLDIKNRLLHTNHSYEAHLQAYIIQNFDNCLSTLLLPNNLEKLLWIGNEVICSFGEQRIDILIVSETPDETIIRVIELKDDRPTSYITHQLQWYLTWTDQYIAPNLAVHNKKVKIVPTIIAKCFNRNTKRKRLFVNAFQEFNLNKPQLKNSIISDLEFISFAFENNDIMFKKEMV